MPTLLRFDHPPPDERTAAMRAEIQTHFDELLRLLPLEPGLAAFPKIADAIAGVVLMAHLLGCLESTRTQTADIRATVDEIARRLDRLFERGGGI